MASEFKDVKVNANLDGLEKLLKSLKSDYVVRVGILGKDGKGKHDKKSGLTNAELGAIHEFGAPAKNIPQRSFLQMPLELKLNFKDGANKNLKKLAWKCIFERQNQIQFFTYLGKIAEDIIREAFATNGFGNWQRWSKSYERRRKLDISKSMRRKLNKEYFEKYGKRGFFSLQDVKKCGLMGKAACD